MSTLGPRDFDAILRDALRAEAESVEPQGGGFDQIVSRLRRPLPLPIAWLMHAWSFLAVRVPADVAAAAEWLADVTRRVAAAARRHAGPAGHWLAEAWRTAERFLPGPANRHGRRSRLGWLRPVAAMTFAIFVITAGVYAAIDVSQNISPTNGGAGSVGSSQHGGHSGGGVPASQSSASYAPGTAGPGGVIGPSQSSRCKTSTATPKPSSNPSSSPSPTTSPTSPSPTSTPTSASPTTSSSPTQSSSPSPSATTSSPPPGSTSPAAVTDFSAEASSSPCPGKTKQPHTTSAPAAFEAPHLPSVTLFALDEQQLLTTAAKARIR